jgi:hypothetical protein
MPAPDTLPRLQKIEQGAFEKLAAGYLSNLDGSLAGVINTGINEDGRTIPCPVDGILFVHGDPPRCVAVAATTIGVNNLRNKWFDGQTGDVAKAALELGKWTVPEIRRQLYLVTNHLLRSDLPLYRDAIEVGLWLGVEVTVVEGSQLLRFLDTNPEGQYLRQIFLGVDVQRLSASLLRSIARRSLAQHRSCFPPLTQEEVVRDLRTEILTHVGQSDARVIVLRGPSGTGKSALLRQVGAAINETDGFALWIPAEDISQADPLPAALLHALQRFEPSLETRAGDDAIEIASAASKGLVLLIDDINRHPSPQVVWNAVRSWSGSLEANVKGREFESLPRFLIPVWPESPVRASAQRSSQRDLDTRMEYLDVGTYSDAERARLAELFKPGYQNIGSLIDALDGDPFLCGLAAVSGSASLNGVLRADVIRRVFEEYLVGAARHVAQIHSLHATPGEVVGSIDQLVEFMLRHRDPEPVWNSVREALGNRAANILHALSALRSMGWVTSHGLRETWRWKHERLRNALIGRWIASHLFARSETGGDETLLGDPGLAEACALVPVFVTGDREAAVSSVAKRQPIASAEMLKLSLLADQPGLESLVVNSLREVVRTIEVDGGYVGTTREGVVLAKLAATDNRAVLGVAAAMPNGWYKATMRFRNGDIQAGLTWLRVELTHHGFPPAIRYYQLESTVEAFDRLYQGQRQVVVEQLRQGLDRDATRGAGLVLAGYLAWPELAGPIATAWRALPENEKLDNLACGVWALSRLCSAGVREDLDVALRLAEKLSGQERTEGNVHHPSERYYELFDPLQHSARWPITADAVGCWINVAQSSPELSNEMY